MNAPAPTPASPSATAALSLPVQGMSCASCVGRVEKAVRKVQGVAEVSVNLATERIHIQPAGKLRRGSSD